MKERRRSMTPRPRSGTVGGEFPRRPCRSRTSTWCRWSTRQPIRSGAGGRQAHLARRSSGDAGAILRVGGPPAGQAPVRRPAEPAAAGPDPPTWNGPASGSTWRRWSATCPGAGDATHLDAFADVVAGSPATGAGTPSSPTATRSWTGRWVDDRRRLHPGRAACRWLGWAAFHRPVGCHDRGRARCSPSSRREYAPDYIDYHDTEWGAAARRRRSSLARTSGCAWTRRSSPG